MAEEEIWEEGRNRKFNMLSIEGQLGIYLKAQERGKAFALAKGTKIVVTENPPANAGDTGLSPGLGRSQMPWSS